VGRVVDADGQPLPEVDLMVEGWLPQEAPASFRRAATSGEAGEFRLERLPLGTHRLTARRRGYTDHAQDIELTSARERLPDLRLRSAAGQPVRVLDDLGVPVAGALVRHGAGRTHKTGADGAVVISGVAPGERVEVAVSAPGHVAARAVVPVGGDEMVLRLRRASIVRGGLADEAGQPPRDPRLTIELGRTRIDHAVPPSGEFEIDLEPERRATLVFGSSGAGEVRREVAPGPPGSVVDLGVVVLPRGYAASGRIWNARTGKPLGGARIWALRHSPAGALVAWAHGETVESRSDQDGMFVLAGLPPAGTILRVDAPGHARRFVPYVAEGEPGELPTDLGDIWLTDGAAVEATAAEAPRGTVLRVYPRGDWSEIDLLSAPLVDGSAVVENVPPGEILVTVGAGRDVRCEEHRSVSDGERVAVDCDETGVAVSGTVVVGGRAAGPGRLTWSQSGRELPAGVILRDTTPTGARRQRIYGAGPADREVNVDASGFFAAEGLAPGEWSISWLPREGYFSPPATLIVPDGDLHQVELSFAAGIVAGTVRDEERAPVARAVVRDVDSAAFAISGDGGEFELAGLGAGRHRLFALLADRRSDVVEVLLDPHRSVDPVSLVLGERHEDELTVEVRDEEGGPAPAALVVLDLGGGRARILTADHLGRATAVIDPPWPMAVGVAVHHAGRWAFASSSPLHGGDLVIGIERTGEMLVRTSGEGAHPALITATGHDVSEALRRVGVPLRVDPDQPAIVSGLPAGRYELLWRGERIPLEIRDGERTEVEIP
jgi:hypothetical protein